MNGIDEIAENLYLEIKSRQDVDWKPLLTMDVPLGIRPSEKIKTLSVVLEQQHSIDPNRSVRIVDKDGKVLVQKESRLEVQRRKLMEQRQKLHMSK